MYRIDLDEAKERLTDLIRNALDGEEVVITQDDQPVVKLVPMTARTPRRRSGSARGLITMADDFDAPLEDFREYAP